MSRISEAFLEPTEEVGLSIPDGMYEATFVDDVTSVEDLVRVHLLATPVGSFHGPAPWTPRVDGDGAVLMPSRGDRCLVSISDDEQTWVVAWWPYAS